MNNIDKSVHEQHNTFHAKDASNMDQHFKALVEFVPDVESVINEQPTSSIEKQIKLMRLKILGLIY